VIVSDNRTQHDAYYRAMRCEVRHELQTPIEQDGYDAYQLHGSKHPCPYHEIKERGKWLQWMHGFCVADAERKDYVREIV
jgi:ribosome modulation factor